MRGGTRGSPGTGSVRDVASRLLISLTGLHSDIGRWRNRIQYLPSSVAENMRQTLMAVSPDRSIVTARDIKAELESTVRPVVALDTSEEDPPMTASDVLELTGIFEEFRTLADLFFLGSGLPPSSFGIGIGRGESGVARERAQDAASSRARAYRRDLAECLPQLALAAGMPQAEVTFNWSAGPFEDRKARQQELLELKKEGIIDAAEVRAALGWPLRHRQRLARQRSRSCLSEDTHTKM